MKPSYNDETLAAYFQPLRSELWEDSLVGPVLRRLAVEDPDIIAAVADVDRSQVRDNLRRTPAERLQAAFSMAEALSGFRRAAIDQVPFHHPREKTAISPATRATSSSVSPGNTGSASTSRAARSDSGRLPSPAPRTAKLGWRCSGVG